MLLAPFFCIVIAQLFYWIGSPERLWGPRYYFEGFAGLWLLAAVGLTKAWEYLTPPPSPLLTGDAQRADRGMRWRRPALIAVVTLLVAINLLFNLPARLQEAHGFYGISRAQLQPIEAADLHNALVIVYADRWLEYGALLGHQSPLLDDDVIYPRREWSRGRRSGDCGISGAQRILPGAGAVDCRETVSFESKHAADERGFSRLVSGNPC